jgi:hypothetical protein
MWKKRLRQFHMFLVVKFTSVYVLICWLLLLFSCSDYINLVDNGDDEMAVDNTGGFLLMKVIRMMSMLQSNFFYNNVI